MLVLLGSIASSVARALLKRDKAPITDAKKDSGRKGQLCPIFRGRSKAEKQESKRRLRSYCKYPQQTKMRWLVPRHGPSTRIEQAAFKNHL